MDKLITDKLSLSLDQNLRNDLIDNFKKIENNESDIDNKDSRVVDIANNANNVSNDTKQRLDNFIANSAQPSEVVDSRHSSTTGKDYSVLSDRLNEIEEYQRLGIVNFTFDDSYRENRLTKSIFDEYGLICDFAVITDKVNNATNDYQGIDWYIDAYNQGYGIQSHTRTHHDLNVDGLSDTEVYREIVSSKKILENLGLPVSGFVSPSSVTKEAYSHLIEENYDYAINHLANNHLSSPMDQTVDRHHLQRMSLAATDIDLIKRAIDKTIDNKMLLMFYDHRTGREGSASEEKLREILDYVKQKNDANKLKVLKSVDAISDFFKISPNKSNPVVAKANELALPIGRYLLNQEKDETVWNITAKSNPSCEGYNANGKYITIKFDGNSAIEKAYFSQFVDVSSHKGERQPHYLSISAVANGSDDIINNLVAHAFVRFFNEDGNQLSEIKEKPVYITGDRIVHSNLFGYPNNATQVEIGFTFDSATPLSGKISLLQPSILEDQVGYTGDFKDVDTNMQVMLKPEFKVAQQWEFAGLPSFTAGLPRRYFAYNPDLDYITTIIPGTYDFRTLIAYKITGNSFSINPRVLLEVRINDDVVSHSQALMRVQSTHSADDIYNIDSSLKAELKAGDQVRFAMYEDMAGTPTMEASANSFVIIRREV